LSIVYLRCNINSFLNISPSSGLFRLEELVTKLLNAF
jgi:hypothetical protein